MAILRDCELWHCRLDPERPNAKYNKENPTWEAQIRTTVKEQKDEWVAEGLKVKVAMDKEDETKFLYWYVNLRKKSIKSDGDAGGPVKVIDGELKEVNPNSIGNGSRGNVRLFQYNHPNGTASVLMGIQLTTHIVYHAPERAPDDDFSAVGTTNVIDNGPPAKEETPAPTPTAADATPSVAPSPTPNAAPAQEDAF